jgi:hypothetical protein
MVFGFSATNRGSNLAVFCRSHFGSSFTLMCHTAVQDEQRFTRIAGAAILRDGVFHVLAVERDLQFGGEQRQAVQEQHQIDTVISLFAFLIRNARVICFTRKRRHENPVLLGLQAGLELDTQL